MGNDGMTLRQLREELVRKRDEAQRALDALDTAMGIVADKPYVSEPSAQPKAPYSLKDCTQMEAVETVLRHEGSPMHLKPLAEKMRSMGFSYDGDHKALRKSLSATLDARVRNRDTFTRPQPGTYGLLEWETQASTNTEAENGAETPSSASEN